MRLGTVQSWLAAATVVVNACAASSAQGQSAPADGRTWKMYRHNEPAPPVQDPKATGEKPTWKMYRHNEVPPVNCAAMETELATTSAAYNASCSGHLYTQDLQKCTTLSNQLMAGSQRLQAHNAVCKAWSAAALQQNIDAARGAIRNIEMVRTSSQRRSRGRDDEPSRWEPSGDVYTPPRQQVCTQYPVTDPGNMSNSGMTVCY